MPRTLQRQYGQAPGQPPPHAAGGEAWLLVDCYGVVRLQHTHPRLPPRQLGCPRFMAGFFSTAGVTEVDLKQLIFFIYYRRRYEVAAAGLPAGQGGCLSLLHSSLLSRWRCAQEAMAGGLAAAALAASQGRLLPLLAFLVPGCEGEDGSIRGAYNASSGDGFAANLNPEGGALISALLNDHHISCHALQGAQLDLAGLQRCQRRCPFYRLGRTSRMHQLFPPHSGHCRCIAYPRGAIVHWLQQLGFKKVLVVGRGREVAFYRD